MYNAKKYHQGRWGRSNNYHEQRGWGWLKPGMKGFLCSTMKNRENNCVKEAYYILKEYSPPEEGFSRDKVAKVTEVEKSEEECKAELPITNAPGIEESEKHVSCAPADNAFSKNESEVEGAAAMVIKSFH